jgi:protein kinase-like protein/cellulose binding protein with CBM2 domain
VLGGLAGFRVRGVPGGLAGFPVRGVPGGLAGDNRHMGLMGRVGQQDAPRIGERYRLVEKLGTGGMSVVWRGYDEILGREVAVKVLSPQFAGDVVFRDRLRQEALAAARLCHPHITGIFDFGESPLSANISVPYVVMELNDGESVAARLHRQGPLPWHDAVGLAAEVASALAAAHARGVVHRDITPTNVMLTEAGAKVVDFGISAPIGGHDAGPDGSLLGTPAYLAPERLGGSRVRPAADMYALGLLLYQSLTGRLPWPADNTAEVLRAHLYSDPEPLPPLPGLPAEVAELCLRCLAKNPGDRPTAAVIANRLAAAIGRQPIVAVTPRTNGFPVRGVAQPRPAPRRPGVVASARALLGLPAPVTGVRRLRAGLRIGAALRVGGVQPLGGGVFVGGHLARDVLSGRRIGRAVVIGGHRTSALVATVALLVVIGLSWSSTRDPVEVRSAQAAASRTGAAAAIARGAGCEVRYQVRSDSGRDFEALLTVRNTGDRDLLGWRVEFAYPGTQRLAATPGRVVQAGRKVVVSGRAGGRLSPGRAVAVTLRGGYRRANPLPLMFRLDGRPCAAVVIGATTAPATDAVEPRPSRVARRGGASVGA